MVGIALLSCAMSNAASSAYRFESWTADNALPSNWTLGIQQTPDGYLWLIARGGLLRFDGLHFTSFNRVNTPALRSTNFTSFGLTLDREGGLWAATWTGGAIRYFRGEFKAYTTRDGLPNNAVVRIDEDEKGDIWIFTSPGVSVWRKGRIMRSAPGRNSAFEPHLAAPPNLGIDPYLLGLWRFENNGWQRFAVGQWQNFPLPAEIRQPRNVRLDLLTEDREHRVWFKIVGREREIFCVQSGRLTVFKGVPKDSFACYQDRLGRLWITDHEGRTGLWANGQFTPFEGLSTPTLFQVFEDRDHNFWVGTLNQGLFRLTKQSITILRFAGGPGINRISSVLGTGSGDIWVASRGLTRLRNQEYRTFVRQHRNQKWFEAQIAGTMFLDVDGTIWAGYPDGLERFKAGKFCDANALQHAVQGEINAMLRDGGGDLWLGGEGLYRLHGPRLDHYASGNGLPLGQVRVLLEDPSRGIWIATDNGLFFFKDGGFRTWTEKDGLSSDHLIALYMDKQGVLWIGTSDGGINRFENGKFIRITSENGLATDDVDQIFEDHRGFFWLTSRRGVSRVSKEQLNAFAKGISARVCSLRLGKRDGLDNIDCRIHSQPGGYQQSNGTLLLPTL